MSLRADMENAFSKRVRRADVAEVYASVEQRADVLAEVAKIARKAAGRLDSIAETYVDKIESTVFRGLPSKSWLEVVELQGLWQEMRSHGGTADGFRALAAQARSM